MADSDDPAGRGGFHIDKRIPLAVIFAMVVQTVVVGAFMGRLDQRVTSLEEKEVRAADGPGRLVRVETQIDDVRRAIDKIDTKIDRLVQRGTVP